ELHLDLGRAAAFARRTPTLRAVEREAARVEALHARLGSARVELAQRLHETGVRRRDARGRASNRTCIDHDDARAAAVDAGDALPAPVALLARERGNERVEHERRLARARRPAHAGDLAVRELEVDALQVVRARAGELHR